MLQVKSEHSIAAIEPALRRAAARNHASVLAVSRVGHIARENGADAVSFTICHPDLYSGLLAGDIRMAAFLPCRIAAYTDAGQVSLSTVSPLEFCRLLSRPDLAPLANTLEAALVHMMQHAAEAASEPVPAGVAAPRGGFGATEDQVHLAGAVPQRIDCRGTKVEDLGGTGEHDAQGG